MSTTGQSSPAIKLNYINQSNDVNNSDVVIFQKNAATGAAEIAVAWTVIQNCGQGEHHPFVYPLTSAVGAEDSFGNFSPQLSAENGQRFEVKLTDSGDQLALQGAANSPNEIEIANSLAQGAINAFLYKDGRLLLQKTNVAPGQMASFQVRPTIFIGVASQVEQGEVLDAAIISEINTEISLLGISSADIVMTGGGAGPDAQPFQFTLQNVVMA